MKDTFKKVPAWAWLVLIIIGLGIGYWIGYDIGYEKSQKDSINSFEDCAAADYPIQESFPEVCRTPDGRTFTNN